jgi:hypothetical protein
MAESTPTQSMEERRSHAGAWERGPKLPALAIGLEHLPDFDAKPLVTRKTLVPTLRRGNDPFAALRRVQRESGIVARKDPAAGVTFSTLRRSPPAARPGFRPRRIFRVVRSQVAGRGRFLWLGVTQSAPDEVELEPGVVRTADSVT